MNDVIKIEEKNGIPTVNARDLHVYLEVGRDFSSWIKQRIEKYAFAEGVDFTKALTGSGELIQSGITRSIEYFLSIDMAKELCMVENNDQGQLARRYFIMIEKAYRKSEAGKMMIRNKSKEVRVSFTDSLQEHGYTKKHHYIQTTKQMRNKLGIEKSKDDMSKIELKKVMAAELLSEINIEQADAFGYPEVNPICVESCQAVIMATELKRQIA